MTATTDSSFTSLSVFPERQDDEGLLSRARSLGLLSALDQHFSSRLVALYREPSDAVAWALALASRQESRGHVCADLSRLSQSGLTTDSLEEPITYSVLAASESLEAWLDELTGSALVECVSGAPWDKSKARPLVLDDRGRLYLRRAYESQSTLAERIRERTRQADFAVNWPLAEAGIQRKTTTLDQQDTRAAVALRVGLSRPLTVVTGGPGTGKTTLVARMVALLVEDAISAGQRSPKIRLMAPTGKAAAAMTSSFSLQRESLALNADIHAAMDVAAETVHRALLKQTRRDVLGRPLTMPFDDDIVIIDESSMVDMALMAKIFEACQGVGRIMLLGDPFQLASVDSGAVLSEICGGEVAVSQTQLSLDLDGGHGSGTGLGKSIVTLTTSHRFSVGGGIGRLADAIRDGNADVALGILDDPSIPEVTRFEVDSVDHVRARLVESSRQLHSEIQAAATLPEKLERMTLYRVLCAHRRGPLGVEALCTNLDEAAAGERKTNQNSDWWLGRMLLVTKNSPEQNLWNGDVGLIEETSFGLRALFADGAGGVRALSAGGLPSHESAIAMSVHKSQGSEFAEVDLVLGHLSSRVMTRELLYTGVTRARNRLRIHATSEVIRDAIGRRVARDSGLAELIWAD